MLPKLASMTPDKWLGQPADTQKDDFCSGIGIWIWKCPDNIFGQIGKIKGYNSKYHCVSEKM